MSIYLFIILQKVYGERKDLQDGGDLDVGGRESMM